MAIFKAINVKVGRNANLKGIINYVLRPDKTEQQLATGICCDVPEALKTFTETKQCFGKLKGRQYYHFTQSFPPNENITAEQAHEAALKFAEECRKFWGYEMLVVTHKDRDHLHTHFVLNSVSFIDGQKFHMTRKELSAMKELQNQICIGLGYKPAPKKGFDMYGNKRKNVTANNSKTFRLLKKAEANEKNSYLQNCSKAFVKATKIARTKEQFIQLMQAQGFETEWKDNKKHITFTDLKLKQDGVKKCKVRLKKLAQYFPELKEYKTKEGILNGFEHTELHGTDNTRSVVAANNTDKPKVRRSTGLIDFTAGYEQYSAGVDTERAERAAQEAARRNRELEQAEQQRIERERRAAQIADEQNRRKLQQQNSGIPEINRKPVKPVENNNECEFEL